MALVMQLVEGDSFHSRRYGQIDGNGHRLRPVIPSQAALLIGNTPHNIAALRGKIHSLKTGERVCLFP